MVIPTHDSRDEAQGSASVTRGQEPVGTGGGRETQDAKAEAGIHAFLGTPDPGLRRGDKTRTSLPGEPSRNGQVHTLA